MLAALKPERAPSCPEATCSNHGIPVTTKGHYHRFGVTASGSLRYRCKVCKQLFSLPIKSTLRQREPHKNRRIFELLVNGMAMRRICKVERVSADTLYRKLGFFHDQVRLFVADRERALMERLKPERLYVSVDRQDYLLNWSTQTDRRNIMLHAVGSADNRSGYVFGMHLDFDVDMDPAAVEADAKLIGDATIVSAYRKYARVWLKGDYTDVVRKTRQKAKRLGRARKKALRSGGSGVISDIRETYAEIETRTDVEIGIEPDYDTQLPRRGMQTHAEYTLYGHFFYLAQLFRGAGKVRFYLDQESGIRAACLSAFNERIKAREVDAFYVRINKAMTINERRRCKAQAESEFAAAKAKMPGLSDQDVQIELIKQRMAGMPSLGRWSDRWLLHPFPDGGEPDKAVCYLTDFRDYTPEHLARLYQRASLKTIDRFFMQVRRGLSLLERPIKTASAQGRAWHGKSPYSPEVVVKILEVFRVYFNYCEVGEDGKTPAMRIGLAKGPIRVSDLLYFVPEETLKLAA